ncbi:tripartite tricarboxylate transporter substrate binding protein BugD [soil metagenome]
MKHPLRCAGALALICSLFATPALADYPDKPITLLVPFAAGGPSDKIARDLAEAMSKPLGQTIVVENATGAGGTIGTARLARANPDGYTLLVHHIGLATAPALYKNSGFKTSDLAFLGLINEAPSTLIGKPTLAANTLAELRKTIAESGSKLNLANAGVGSASHLCELLLQNALKSDMTLVPYRGTGPAMTDLMGGQVDLMCEQATNSVPQIVAKSVKVYGVSSAKRMELPALAGVPTLSEAGLAGFDFTVWHGLYAPHGTPKAVLDKINTALRTALKNPDFIKRQESVGITVVTDDRLSPAGHQKFFEGELAKWGKVIKDAGIAPE